MKKIFFTTAVLLSGMLSYAQFTYNYLKAADQYYSKEDYNSAAQYYEKYLGTRNKTVKPDTYKPYAAVSVVKNKTVKVSSEQLAVYKLAESYRNLHNYQKAAPYYETVLEMDKAGFPMAAYYYAVSLRALGKYEDAAKAFHNFVESYTGNDRFTAAANRELQNLEFITGQLSRRDLQLYEVRKAPAALNTTGASYAPLWSNGGTLIFTSTRPDSSFQKNHTYINRLYTADYADGQTSNIRLFNLDQPEALHQGAASLSPDGQLLFLTRWHIDHGRKISAIYLARKNGDNWSQPVLMDTLVNTVGSNTQQPYVLPDGRTLLYASDGAGGYGGFDLWYATLDETGKPLQKANLGNVINTAGNEQAPFYHAATGTLVFSNDSRTGMGGYDFFSSKGSIGNWKTPVNMGYPVNSVKDDIYFASRSNNKNILDEVLLGTDRAAECCLELFFVHKNRPAKQLSGMVVSCDNNTPLADAEVNIIDTVNNKIVFTHRTAADGTYAFTVDEFSPLKAVANANGYTTNTQRIDVPLNEDTAAITAPVLCLVKDVIPPAPVILENVYYDFNKATLREGSFAALDKLAQLLTEHPDMAIELSAHTDSKGKAALNQRLSEARAKSCVEYLVSKGIDRSRLTYIGYGATQPVAPNTLEDGSDNPEGRQKNRRTAFTILKK
ncbi:outer membrane protein OmpA-like peptidoglycan-associated protein [Chitinophaga niastensis]|uniref:Outer membrane protein OmpA-like peptidoglycan-associated protein n=1 Tax=Chitinophaga niastensis TaxID=536980 RepID=A0A2P8HMW3_CHINA|nr:OmpA family protein [Chitinophaga niastensis]PSL47536.1 outer membrane protein OmpA-like peptidoglycan-associated protein [Chitinophaga niastensis]